MVVENPSNVKHIIVGGQLMAIDQFSRRIQIDSDANYQSLRVTPITLGASVNWVTALEDALGTGTVLSETKHLIFLPAETIAAYYNVGAAASASMILIPAGGVIEPYDSEDVIDSRLFGTGGTLFIVEMK